MDKILEVKKLKIAFRTNSGALKAVRDVSFDLERGRTLAIVGESGSGKSVTSRAIMGILAGNAIVEGGEIFYDGKDLMRISEEEMHRLRGDKISMIFQDPLSSLNPIVKIGKQITEAMLLKNKTSRREARREFKTILESLNENMILALGNGEKSRIDAMTKTFDKLCIKGTQLENDYNNAEAKAQEISSLIADFLFRVEKKAGVSVANMRSEAVRGLRRMRNPLLTGAFNAKLDEHADEINRLTKNTEMLKVSKVFEACRNTLEAILSQTRPDFVAIGYYLMKKPGTNVEQMKIEELNRAAAEQLENEFMTEFSRCTVKALEYSANRSLEKKKAILPVLEEAKAFYEAEFSKKDGLSYAKKLIKKVEDSIDRMELVKDSAAYTFRTSITNSIEKYYKFLRSNPKEEARFARQTAKRKRLVDKGKHVTWKVVPKNVYDLEELRDGVALVVVRLIERYEAYIKSFSAIDFNHRAKEMVDLLRDKASQVVYRVTKTMAKEKAIKLMEEVGIHEPRIRYYQYPFEFSGGMRQRIVIAIALAANPDILICDEPTTALDVTIQAQILELIQDLKKKRNLSVIFITHDLGVVANIADDIAVMYAGKIVEYGTAEDIFYDPRHPYTWALLSSMPDLDTKEKLDAIPGTPPNMVYPPVGDAFADRNKYAMKIDFEQQPPMFDISSTHRAATWLLHPSAPKVETPKGITDRIARMNAKMEARNENGGAQA